MRDYKAVEKTITTVVGFRCKATGGADIKVDFDGMGDVRVKVDGMQSSWNKSDLGEFIDGLIALRNQMKEGK